jgi:hypothetical protein
MILFCSTPAVCQGVMLARDSAAQLMQPIACRQEQEQAKFLHGGHLRLLLADMIKCSACNTLHAQSYSCSERVTKYNTQGLESIHETPQLTC